MPDNCCLCGVETDDVDFICTPCVKSNERLGAVWEDLVELLRLVANGTPRNEGQRGHQQKARDLLKKLKLAVDWLPVSATGD